MLIGIKTLGEVRKFLDKMVLVQYLRNMPTRSMEPSVDRTVKPALTRNWKGVLVRSWGGW